MGIDLDFGCVVFKILIVLDLRLISETEKFFIQKVTLNFVCLSCLEGESETIFFQFWLFKIWLYVILVIDNPEIEKKIILIYGLLELF